MLPIAIPARQCRASSYSSAGASSAFRHGARYKQQTCTCKASNRCHYEVLGVDNSASANDIKRAFRKLALKLHPDVNTAPDAAAAFTAAKSAYEVLSDPQQRAAYNNSLKQNHVHSRSSTRSWQSGTSSSSGRRRRAQSRGTYTEYVIYDFSNFGDEVEEEEIAEAAGAGFHGWYAESGSWQSSWEANKKKQQKRHKQQQQQQQAQWRQEQQWQALTELLQQQDPQTLGVVAHVFGEGLEDLNSIEELLDLLAGLELLKEEGIEPDVSMFETRADRHNRSTRRRRSSNGAHESNPDSQSSRHHSKQANAADASSSRRSRGAGSSAGHGTSSRQQQEATAAGRRGRQKTTSSSKQQGNTSRSSKAGKMPRFEELSFEELLTFMQDQRQPMVAQAAREWASSYNFADPRLAADVEAFLTLEYLSGGWDDGSIAAGLNSNSSSSMWQHVSFDYDEYAERQKCKAKPGSARDYVRYQVEDEDDLADVRQYIKDEFGCIEIDDIYLGSNWEGDDCDDVVYVRF